VATPKPVLNVAYPVIGGTQTPLWLGAATGAYEAHGVTVNMQYAESSTTTRGLVAKTFDAVLQSAAPIITANVNGGQDLVYVASVLNHSQFALLVRSDIKSAEDLKGQPIGNDHPGTTTDFQTRVLLEQLGLQPSDVVIRELGGSDILIQALLTNQIAAAAMIPPQSFKAQAAGYTQLANTYSIPYQNVGVVVSRSRLDELAPALRGFVPAYREGILAFNSQPELAKQVLSQYSSETDPTILQQTYDFYRTQAPFQVDLRPTLEGIRSMINFLAATIVPNARDAQPEQFVDLRFLADIPTG
jgi:ABC-type nitrate/sulfonate/bicarbonate transport system substrate-binding protein